MEAIVEKGMAHISNTYQHDIGDGVIIEQIGKKCHQFFDIIAKTTTT